MSNDFNFKPVLPQKKEVSAWKALTIVSNIFWGIGWIFIIAAIIVFFMFSGDTILVAIIAVAAGGFLAVISFAASELIKLFISIEENTRLTARRLRKED